MGQTKRGAFNFPNGENTPQEAIFRSNQVQVQKISNALGECTAIDHLA